MSTHADFAEFEAQFAKVEPTTGQLRVRGWVIVLGASVVLWGGIAVIIAAAIHAL